MKNAFEIIYLTNDTPQHLYPIDHLRATKLVLGRVYFPAEELVQRRKPRENYGTVPKITSQKTKTGGKKGHEMRQTSSNQEMGRGSRKYSDYTCLY